MTEKMIHQAAEFIRTGRLVAFPTETVYGLGADATNDLAVAKVFDAKGRPEFNPLIVHINNISDAEQFVSLKDRAHELANAFWPGPLTLILPRLNNAKISRLASAGLDTIAIRCPDNEIAQALLQASKRPVVAPSANRSGHLSPTEACHVAEDLGTSVDLIIDGGKTTIGIESTVLALMDTPEILRPGAITKTEIEKIIGEVGSGNETHLKQPETLRSPGQLQSHYAPNAHLRLNTVNTNSGEALLAFGANRPASEGPVINLSPSGDLTEAASRLFSALRELDKSGCRTIAVMPIPCEGLGVAINDRLNRAAAPRNSDTNSSQ